MIAKGSRYEKSKAYLLEGADEPFRGIRSREIKRAEGVLEHTLSTADRIDLLALHYYNDARLWWRIIDANPEILFAGAVNDGSLAGTVILIPRGGE